ncbi:DinB family protein [Euzebyella marina]|uniref:DinB family protein n=2 Tax=Euzebyella marina TaxID=1761453 RepID=A0A3G2L6R3_9FLAO|nr:DinB family protein [Euzebyella marina]
MTSLYLGLGFLKNFRLITKKSTNFRNCISFIFKSVICSYSRPMNEIERFDQTLNLWSKSLLNYPLEQLVKRPDKESWSLGQVYEHLINETNWYFDQLEGALNDLSHQDMPMSEKASELFKRGSFEDKRVKTDPLISDNVPQPNSIESLTEKLLFLKKRAQSLWQKMVSGNYSGKTRHPGLGYFNAHEWLAYSEMHLRHHLKQKARIDTFLSAIN